ncbi:unnamed protein product [Phytophthora fragariaefolia]|uniref:Unnamed protein product n=1 Tax=Phytophthora fragariaefolia TaxID=1490495 RepID=A0A9W7D420_9STRA|nr:unnamed protein product [Phytophthora fragariaefolia]
MRLNYGFATTEFSKEDGPSREFSESLINKAHVRCKDALITAYQFHSENVEVQDPDRPLVQPRDKYIGKAKGLPSLKQRKAHFNTQTHLMEATASSTDQLPLWIARRQRFFCVFLASKC